MPRTPVSVVAALLAVFATFTPSPSQHAVAGPPAPDPDEQFLRENGLPTDGPALLDYFRKRAPSGANLKRLEGLVRQLGDEEFLRREQACAASFPPLPRVALTVVILDRPHVREKLP